MIERLTTSMNIPKMIENLGIRQGGRPDFSAGTSGIAEGKTRSEDEKDGAKPTPDENQIFNHFVYSSIHNKWRKTCLAK